MAWDDFSTPTADEVINESAEFVTHGVRKYECPDCGHETVFAFNTGYNYDGECDECGRGFRFVG